MKKLFILLLTFAMIGCSGNGTNTGNPNNESTPNSGMMPVTGRESNILGNALCNKIKSCNPSSSDSVCKTQVQSLANFTDEILLNPPYATLGDLEDDVQDTTFTFNLTSLNECLNGISAISCNSAIALSAYTLSSPNDFSNAYKLFRASTMCLSLE